MKVEKYRKKRNGRYLVVFTNGREIELYEEVILKYELLLKKDIDPKSLIEIISFNEECHGYYIAINFLKSRARSKKEVIDMLRKQNCSDENITNTIAKLEKQGYLNDKKYANSFLNQQLLLTTRGPKKIAYELEKKGISKDIIQTTLVLYDNEIECEKIEKIVDKMIASNRNKSNLLLKKKMENDLLYQGFSKDNIDKVLNRTCFQSDQDLYQKEYDKLYKKLQRKYSGNMLEYQVRQKLYQKGFRYEK